MTGRFILRPFPSPASTAANSASVPAPGAAKRKPNDECRDEPQVASTVEIWKSQTQRFPDSHRSGGCYFLRFRKNNPERNCYPSPRSIVLPMSQSTHGSGRDGAEGVCGDGDFYGSL